MKERGGKAALDPPSTGLELMLRHLVAHGRPRELARGEVLFHQSDPALAIFGLSEGRVRLDRHLADGRVVTVGVARGPGLLAEAALYSPRYRCSATAETPCRLTRISKESVLEILERDPSVALDFIRILVTEVRELRTRLELRNVRPASERLLRYLELLRDHGSAGPAGPAGPAGSASSARSPVSDRPLSALADELGLAPETLYRVVARLEREGRLRRRGRRLELLAKP